MCDTEFLQPIESVVTFVNGKRLTSSSPFYQHHHAHLFYSATSAQHMYLVILRPCLLRSYK